MKKVIVKSVIVTACILLVVVKIGSMIVSFFFPQTVSDLAFRVNAVKTCVNYQEKAYLKDKEFDTLALLTERCIWASDDEKVIIYAEKFITDEKFNDYAKNVDESYAYYIITSFVISLYNEGYKTKSVETAFKESNGFKTVGPIHRLIAYASEKGDKETLNVIKQKLITYDGDEYASFLINVIDNELQK